jgi:hypothetical protein
MLINEDCMSPPPAVWAKAEEMNTMSPGVVVFGGTQAAVKAQHGNVPQAKALDCIPPCVA